MDAVITYVDGLDPEWRESYEKTVGHEILAKRFRNWDTLLFVFRGIERFMPYIKNVYLVVASQSQVPSWVDRNHVKVVLHSDFIPAKFLPTFNSNTIEMHLHRIPGLDEEYIYFNDDIIPVRDLPAESFFRDGKIVVKHVHHIFAGNFYKKIVKATDCIAKKLANRRPSPIFIRPQHSVSSMLRSNCEYVYDKGIREIEDSITTVRSPRNFTQYIFSDYLYYMGETVQERISNKHFSLAASGASSIERFLKHPTEGLVCINDVQMDDESFRELHSRIFAAFSALMPEKSRYEI